MKPIPGLDGYWATEMGQIISTRDGERVIKPRPDGKGYLVVTLTVRTTGGRKRHRFAVHRLVALAFLGRPGDGRVQTRHLNGCSTDNRAANLAWGSPVENAADSLRHGTLGKGMCARHRRLTDVQVLEIKERIAAGEAGAALANRYGVSVGYPEKIARGARWGHLNVA